MIQEQPGSTPHTLPLFTEEWVDEFLSRIFTIITNLDSPDGGHNAASSGGSGDEDGSSFLLQDNSMFRPLMELLFVRLPRTVQVAAAKKTASFLLGNILTSMCPEAAVLCNGIVLADPALAVETLLVPVLKDLKKDCHMQHSSAHHHAPETTTAAASTLTHKEKWSRVQETSIKWRLNIVSATVYRMGAALLPHVDDIKHVLGHMIGGISQSVQESSADALVSIIICLCTYYPSRQHVAYPTSMIGGGNNDRDPGYERGGVAVECYFDLTGSTGIITSQDGLHNKAHSPIKPGAVVSSHSTAPAVPFSSSAGHGITWHIPTEDEINATNALLDRFLVAPAQHLLELHRTLTRQQQQQEQQQSAASQTTVPSSTTSKETIRSLLHQIHGALTGARSCLFDFPACRVQTGQNHTSLDTGNARSHSPSVAADGSLNPIVNVSSDADTPSSSIALSGRMGPPVGTPALRSLAVDALLSASEIIAIGDNETLNLCLAVMVSAVESGRAELVEAEDAAYGWWSDEKWLHERRIAGALIELLGDIQVADRSAINSGMIGTYTGGGGGNGDSSTKRDSGNGKVAKGVFHWRGRRPYWLLVEKAYLLLQWRASQAAYRWYPTATMPLLPVDGIPQECIAIVKRSMHFALKGIGSVRSTALSIIEHAMKRYPSLVPYVFAPVFCALAKVEDERLFEFSLERQVGDVIEVLHATLSTPPSLPGAPVGDDVAMIDAMASAAGAAESEEEQAAALGASAFFRKISVWRYLSRNWTALYAFVIASMASAAHTGADAQSALSMMHLMGIFRMIQPPTIEGSTPQAAAEAAAAICRDSISVAGGKGASILRPFPWKYAANANGFPLFVLTEVPEETAATLMRHYLTQMASEILVTRQLAAAGITFLVSQLWNHECRKKRHERHDVDGVSESISDVVNKKGHKESMPATTSPAPKTMTTALRPKTRLSSRSFQAAHAALVQTMADSGSTLLPKLFVQLANSHTSLAANNNDGQSQRTYFSFHKEDGASRTLIATMAKGLLWPQRDSPPSVSAGHFLLLHTKLVQVLATAAPHAVMEGLKGVVQGALSVAHDVDRPSMAATAEVLAGLVASGAPFEHRVGSGNGTQQNGGTNTDGTVTYWDDWVGATFVKALTGCPLDFVDVWCNAAMRYAVHELLQAGKDKHVDVFLKTILHITSTPVASTSTTSGATAPMSSSSSSSSMLYKKVLMMYYAVLEMGSTLGVTDPPHALRALLAHSLECLSQCVGSPGELMRKATSNLVAEIALILLAPIAPCYTDTAPYTATVAAASDTVAAATAAGNGPASSPGMLHGSHSMLVEDDQAVLLLAPSTSSLRTRLLSFLDGQAALFASAADTVHEAARVNGPSAMPALTLGMASIKDDAIIGNGDDGMADDGMADDGDGDCGNGMADGDDDGDGEVVVREMEEEFYSHGTDTTTDNNDTPQSGNGMADGDDDGIGNGNGNGTHHHGHQNTVDNAHQSTTKNAAPPHMQKTVASPPEDKHALDKAIAQIAFTVEMACRLLGRCSISTNEWVFKKILPTLLHIQEVLPSEHQAVGFTARKALLLAKYVPLNGPLCQTVLSTLSNATESDYWPERAAALVFMQYFWFRHAVLLGRCGTLVVLDKVLLLLSDERQEIRETAALTLSGVVRGLSVRDAEALRRKCLERVKSVFPHRTLARGRARAAAAALTTTTTTTAAVAGLSLTSSGAAAAAAAPSLAQRHGAALALQAFVLSSPYDVPPWLPDILMALVKLASEPSPIRSTVTKALSEFRRSHEEGGLVEVKEVLTEEQWEAIRDVASPASYFV